MQRYNNIYIKKLLVKYLKKPSVGSKKKDFFVKSNVFEVNPPTRSDYV